MQRLHRPEEFSAVLSARPVIRGECFAVHYRAGCEGGLARLGLVVPKRLAKEASLRNAIKRQVREAFRLQATRLGPIDLVVRLNKPVRTVSPRDAIQRGAWRREVSGLLNRLPVLAS